MPFDPTSAQPVNSGFDPSSARPAGSRFDPVSAKPENDNYSFGTGIGLGVRNIMEGVAGLGDMIQSPVAAAVDAVQSLGGKKKAPIYSGHGITDAADQLADQMGLPREQNTTQRMVGAGVQGATQGLLTAGGGMGVQGAKGATGVIGKALASSPLFDTASGATSGLSQQGAAELGADPLTQMAAGLIGGLVPSGVHVAAHYTGHTVAGAPKFIQDMFDSRGVDTTPMPDPRESPLANRGMSPQQQEEYHHVLTHGTADDINNFYANSKIPTPDPAKVDQWVTYRDGVPEGYADPSFHPATEDQVNVGAHNQNLQDHIDQQTAGWKNKPDIELINHVDDIQDPVVREQARKEGAQEDAVGFLGTDGKVRMFANRIHTPEQANAVLYHEALGHYGLQEQFGAGLDKTLETLAARNIGSFGTDVKAWMKKNPGAYNGSVARAADEVLAERSGKGPLKPVLMDAIVSHVRRFGRQMGLDLKYNDAEVSHILAMAHDAVINGKGRNVIANQFRGDANKFMFTGRKSTGFDPNSATAFKANDGLVRNEIDDSKSQLISPKNSNDVRLPDLLKHPELYEQYPELKNTKIHFVDDPQYSGSYDPKERSIYLDVNQSMGEFHKAVLHEVQHAIQHIEEVPKFKDTASSRMTKDEYLDNPIEKEAIATENRQTWTNQERQLLKTKFMRNSQMDEQFHNMSNEDQEAWKDSGVRSLQSDVRVRVAALDAFDKFLDENPNIVGSTHRRELLNQFRDEGNPILDEAAGHRFVKSLHDPNELRAFLKNRNDDLQSIIKQRDALVSAKSPGGILENTPEWFYNYMDKKLNGGSYNKFITRLQIVESTSGTYVGKYIDTIYNAMEQDYTPTVKTRAQTIEDAHTLGFSPGQIKALGKTPELAVRSARMTQSLNVMDARLNAVRDKIRANEYTPKDLDEARQIIADQMTIGAKIRDERAEYARALAISKLGYTRKQVESFGKLLEEHGGTLSPLGNDDTLLRFLKKLDEMHEEGNTNGTAVLMKSLGKPNWEDYVTTFHQNMMLSGVSTHFKAPLDMSIGIGRELLESAGALPISLGKEALRSIGVNVKPGIHPTEVAARLGGIVRAFAEAETYRNAGRTFIEGGINPNGFGGRQNARIPIISKVTDLISAQDAFFRAFATNMHLYGLGTRQAVEEARAAGGKINWDDVMSQGASYARTPSEELLKAAKMDADKTLLLNKNKLTSGLDRIKNVGPDASGMQRVGAFVANFLTPFVRVESNSLVNRIIRRSPLAFIDKETRMDLKAGGARADLAMSRIIYGTAGIASYWMAAGQGKTTGNGPDNPAKKTEMMAAGWRPQAVPENGQYNTGDKLGMSINPFDVHNQTATMVASMREAFDKDKNDGSLVIGLKMAMYSMMKSMTEMSWINDIAPAVEAATAPDATLGQKADRFAGEEVATMWPNIIGQSTRVADQAQPDISEKPFLGPIESAIPGVRQSLPVKMTPYGDPVQGGASMLGTHSWLPQDNRITGGNHVDETTDPAEKEMARLGSLMTGGKALVTKANQHITVDDASGFDPKQVTPKPSGSFGVKLTARQYSEYQHLVGRNIVEHIRQEMNSPEWQKMTDEDKAEEVKAISDDMKKEVKEHLYGS